MRRALKEFGLTLQQVCDRMNSDYGVDVTPSAISRSISRDTLRMRRALEILAICGVSQVEIRDASKENAFHMVTRVRGPHPIFSRTDLN